MLDFITDIGIAIIAFLVILSFAYVFLVAFFEWLFDKEDEKTYQRTYVQVRKPPVRSSTYKPKETKAPSKRTVKTVTTETVYLD